MVADKETAAVTNRSGGGGSEKELMRCIWENKWKGKDTFQNPNPNSDALTMYIFVPISKV